MKQLGKQTLWTLAVITSLLLFTVLILPGIIRNMALDRIERATGRKAAIARISLNPFTWSAEVTGFRLAEKGSDTTFASFSSVRLKVSPASLTKRALIVSKLRLVSPYLRLVRTAPNTYNFTDLAAGKKSSEGRKFLYSVNNIEIFGGSVDFRDQAAGRTTDHRIRTMDISVPFISNMPYLADIYVAPHFSAVINGARVSADGRFKPLVRAAETSAIVTVRDLDLPHYAAYLPFALPVRVRSGSLSTAMEIVYRVSAAAQPEVAVSGSVGVRRLELSDRDGGRLFAVGMAMARIRRAALLSRKFDLTSLETAGMELFIDRDKEGRWIWQRLPAGSRTEKAKKEPGVKTILSVARIRSSGGRLHFRDRFPPGGFSTDLYSIEVTATGFSTEKNRKTGWDLSFRSARDESVLLKGGVTVEPVSLAAHLEARGIDCGVVYPYLADRITAPLTGKLDVVTDLAYAADTGVKLDGFSLTVRNLAGSFGGREGAGFREVSLAGGKVSLKEKKAEADSVTLRGGRLHISRDADGGLSAKRILRTRGVLLPAAKTGSPPPPPFNYRIKRVEGSDLDIVFTDRAREEQPVFSLHRMRFRLKEITGPVAAPIPFTLATAFGKKGSIDASGTILPSPLKFRGNFEVKKISLTDFDAYLPADLAVSVAGGAVDGRVRLDLSRRDGTTRGSFGGSLGIRSFYCLDTKENEDLLKWERLQLTDIRGEINPFSLDIGAVSLADFYSRVVITKGGTLNLQNLRSATPGAIPPAGASPQPASPPPAVAKPKIRIGAVTLQGGTMEFSDRHLPLSFSTTFYNLGGKVGGLSSEETRVADVDLRGNLENHSPLAVTGTINPLRKDLFLDMTIRFSDIELSPATPYSGTYLGYAVDKGKLTLALKYHIENRNLSSENKIFIDQLTFGKRVESDKATKLPVRLAVALLKDRKGEIHLDLPVTGRTDDPEFSIWGIVFQVLKNLLVKAATSPFALLQAVFGGKEDFSGVSFTPGSSALSAAERDKLVKLSAAVRDRPDLNVEITGYVDKEKDPEGYRRELLNRKMRTEKFLVLVKEKKNLPDQTPGTTEILPAEYSTYLKAVYRKEKFPKPRNLIGMVKDIPDDEMKKLIFAHTVVGDSELRSLAEERAGTVKAFLMETGKIEPERLFLKSGDIFKAPAGKGQDAARVEFGALVK